MGATKLSACPDCGVAAGQRHQGGCDVERCFWCGEQAIGCECHLMTGRHGTPRTIWTGEWPGTVACRAMGLWAVLRDGEGWVACSPDTPGASADLNRLYYVGRWSPADQDFVPRDGGPPAPETYQDIVDLHLLVRERLGGGVTPPQDYFHNGTRIGAQVRVFLRPKPGDVIAYADSGELFAFKVQA